MDLNQWQREAEAELSVEVHFNMINPEMLELHAAEDVNICGVGIELAKLKLDVGLGEHMFVVSAGKDAGSLGEAALATAPARPEAQLEEGDRKCGSRNGGDDADQGLLTADFGADILAKEAGLKIGKDGFWHGTVRGRAEPRKRLRQG